MRQRQINNLSHGINLFLTVGGTAATNVSPTNVAVWLYKNNATNTVNAAGFVLGGGSNGVFHYAASGSDFDTPGELTILPHGGGIDLLPLDYEIVWHDPFAGPLAAQVGTARTAGITNAIDQIRLSVDASTTESFYKGCIIWLTGGTGAGQSRVIARYTGATQMVEVDRDWLTNPDATTTYAVLGLPSPAMTDGLTTWIEKETGFEGQGVELLTAAAGSGAMNVTAGIIEASMMGIGHSELGDNYEILGLAQAGVDYSGTGNTGTNGFKAALSASNQASLTRADTNAAAIVAMTTGTGTNRLYTSHALSNAPSGGGGGTGGGTIEQLTIIGQTLTTHT